MALTGNAGFAASAAAARAAAVPPAPVEEFLLVPGLEVRVGALGPGSGDLARSDEVDRYFFPASGGDVVFLDALDACEVGAAIWRLVGPDGSIQRNRFGEQSGSACTDRNRYLLPATGTYAVEVSGERRATGGYAFRVIRVRDLAVTLAPGDEVRPDDPLPGAGAIAEAGEIDRYTFEARPGDSYYIASRGCEAPYAEWRLLGPDNAPLPGYYQTVCVDLGRIDVDTGGTYTIAVTAGQASGTHAFFFSPVAPNQRFEVRLGDAIEPDRPGRGAGRLETPGTVDEYAFEADAGRAFRLTSAPDSDCALRWALIDPTGAALRTNMPLCGGTPVPVPLSARGRYTLRISGWQSAAGDYRLRLTAE